VEEGGRGPFWVQLSSLASGWLTQAGSELVPYTNWDSDEPNNGCWLICNEDCTEIKTSGKWNDNDCDDRKHYVCEKRP